MAELIARERYGAAHTFDSSGMAAMIGWEMTDLAQRAVREIGIGDTTHTARDFTTASRTTAPDVIYVMTADHLRMLARVRPDLADRTSLLDPQGSDIEDPYGGTMADYRMARDHIIEALTGRLG